MRQPIVAVLGHVDSGKTTLLDKIRGTGVQGRESGGITQHIGASFLPEEVIRRRCGSMYERVAGSGERVPGLLVIDTPGHEVFANLRTRGGSAADIAVLVVDANRGFQNQTRESLEILGRRKVPFIVALNKVDQVPGWRPGDAALITEAIKAQDPSVQEALDQKVYDVVGTLSVLGYKSEAFYRVRDFSREVSIVPVSARTGLGIPEMLTVMMGLVKQYLSGRLAGGGGGPARGIVLEVNDTAGLGPTANIILVEGSLSKDDTVLVAKRGGAAAARLKAMLLPKPLDEMRDPRDRFAPVARVDAAAGVMLASPDLEGALPGGTVYAARPGEDADALRGAIDEEMGSVFTDTESDGVTVKCDTIGSLEAVASMLADRRVPVARADIGPVTRRDVVGARAVKENDRHLGVVLAFNVRTLPDAQEEAEESRVRIFSGRVIYGLVDEYAGWVDEDSAHEEDAVFAEMTPVARFTFLERNVFRNSGPAVFGIRVDEGVLRQKVPFMNEAGRRVGQIHQLQEGKKAIPSARKGDEVACSVQGVTVGRQVSEGDVFYTLPRSHEAKRLLGDLAHRLDPGQSEALARIVEAQRAIDPAYAY